MSVPYRTVLALGLAVGMLGAGYVFAPHPGAAARTTAPVPPKPAPVASLSMPATPTATPSSTLVVNRAPVPLSPRTHDTYYAPKEAYGPKVPDASLQSASAPPDLVLGGTTTTDGPPASAIAGAGIDGGLPPSDDTKAGGNTEAKAAIELDGYKNVRGLEKGPDGTWRGRAMRGRTEIAVRVDASGSVSAD
jgi:hypothetical protein